MAFPEMNVSPTAMFRVTTLRVAMVALCFALFGCTRPFKKTHKEIRDIGYEGEARSKPYLAAERLFGKLNWDVKTIFDLGDELERGGTLILGGESSISQTTGMKALDWVDRQSGHLILMLRGTESWRDDWDSNFFDMLPAGKELEFHPVLRRLGLKPVSGTGFSIGSKIQEAKIADETYEYASRFGLSFDVTDVRGKVQIIQGQTTDCGILTVPMPGGGRITIVCDGSPFRNRYIDAQDHASLLVALAGLNDNGGNYYWSQNLRLLFSGNDSFFSLLWERYWMAVIALAALLVAWLWKNLPRFGPLQSATNQDVRQFSGHLKMAGTYLWRRRQVTDLLLPMRRNILQKLHARHGIATDEDEGRVLERLATLANLPYDRVANAWQLNFTKDTRIFYTTVRDLQIIEQAL